MRTVIFIIILLSSVPVYAQNGFVQSAPDVVSFSRKDYQGGSQTQDFDQFSNGFIGAANNDGLLIFDGIDWSLYPQPNATILRSILVRGDSIFCGGQNELGYLTFNHSGAKYTSMLDMLPEGDRNLGEVWGITEFQGKIYFRCTDALLSFDGSSMSKEMSVNATSTAQRNNQLIFAGPGGIRTISGDTLATFDEAVEVMGMVDLREGEFLVGTRRNGLYVLTEDNKLQRSPKELISGLCQQYQVNDIVPSTHGIVICTRTGGILILNDQLEITAHYTIEDGLQRNDVITVMEDSNGDLWVGTGNGIDLLKTSSPFRDVRPDGFLKGAGYASANFNGNSYFGTSNGVFKANSMADTDSPFTMVDGTSGQVWGLDQVGDKLWISHQYGLFAYDGSELNKVIDTIGVWKVLPVPGRDDMIIVGHYQGVSVLMKRDGIWSETGAAQELDESSRILAFENSEFLWVTHPYIGAWRIPFDIRTGELGQAKYYGADQGFPSQLHIHAMNSGKEVLFTAEEGLYRYSPEGDSIIKLEEWSLHFRQDTRFLRLFKGYSDDIWYVTEVDFGVLRIEESTLSKASVKRSVSELKGRLVNGFEDMRFAEDGTITVGTEDGFVQFDQNAINSYTDKDRSLVIRSIHSLRSDSTLFWSLADADTSLLVNADDRSLRIAFAPENASLLTDLIAETRLSGFEQEWTIDDGSFTRDYTNLSAGSYRFEMRLTSPSGDVISSSHFEITIRKPWYATSWALAGWIFLLLFVIGSAVWLNQRKVDREMQALVEEKERQLEQQKQESVQVIDKLRNDRLTAEIAHQDKELASVTMHLVQKGQILQSIRDALQELKLEDGSTAKKEVRRIVKLINSDIKLDENWEQFERRFDKVHVDFLERLRKKYPKLTPNDHKLCAYLRMNLSTKEIATIMNISVRGVEISRYRLRKKLDLDSNANLTEFILNI